MQSQPAKIHAYLADKPGKQFSPSFLAAQIGVTKRIVLRSLSQVRTICETNGEAIDTIHRTRSGRTSPVIGLRLDTRATIEEAECSISFGPLGWEM
jgi:hypothetical protein